MDPNRVWHREGTGQNQAKGDRQGERWVDSWGAHAAQAKCRLRAARLLRADRGKNRSRSQLDLLLY